jgi:hypothetical protein
MNVQELVSIYREGGISIKSTGNYHFNRQGFINYSFPNLEKIPINNTLIDSIRWRYIISVLLTEMRRKNSYEFILTTNDYSIDHFAKKIRNRIRKSLQNCSFKRPDLEDLLTFGLAINQQTLKRQNKRDKILTDPGKWRQYISALYKQESITMLGAYFNGRMVGYIIALQLDGKYIINHAFIDRLDSETTDPMNGLIYTLVNLLLKKDASIEISYGLDSIAELPELNRFKSNMLFEPVPVSRVYILHPFLVPFIRFIIFLDIHLFRKRGIRNPFTRKLIRLYQGHRLPFREGSPQAGNKKQ